MKKIIQTIRRNRIFRSIRNRKQEDSMNINIFDDLSDLSQVERKNIFYWYGVINNEEKLIRSNFNLDHWRKVKQARL